MLYNSCTGIYKFGNNTYPRRIRRRSNLGHIFSRGKKSASYGPGNMVITLQIGKYVTAYKAFIKLPEQTRPKAGKQITYLFYC
jgi:hypothetical protein